MASIQATYQMGVYKPKKINLVFVELESRFTVQRICHPIHHLMCNVIISHGMIGNLMWNGKRPIFLWYEIKNTWILILGRKKTLWFHPITSMGRRRSSINRPVKGKKNDDLHYHVNNHTDDLSVSGNGN